ncbi:hypothetical protein BJ878DRAFT_565502 [Calycina marina]|uniref:Uncharacterized protein n=1 Tax=Calycina marina TaxID=1763456 RepID=A0A9P7Z7D8_9HELO|nr:hypothetical protein BJ878DRAFT_565502 [Calycina marina]
MVFEMYEIPTVEIWEALAIADNCDFPETVLNKCFVTWLLKDCKKLNVEEMRELPYPCILAFELTEHITEYNLTDHHPIHLGGNEAGSMNGAKGLLNAKLTRGFFNPVGKFLSLTCSCKGSALFEYMKALSKTGLWSMEGYHKKTTKEILDGRGLLEFEFDASSRQLLKPPASMLYFESRRNTHEDSCRVPRTLSGLHEPFEA